VIYWSNTCIKKLSLKNLEEDFMKRGVFVIFFILVFAYPVFSQEKKEEIEKKFAELVEQNKFEEAVPLGEKLQEIYKKEYGENDTNYARLLGDLGQNYQELNKIDKAEALLKQSLEIYEKTLGQDHPYYAEALNSLGQLYDIQKKYGLAEPLYRKSLAIREKAFGRMNINVAMSLNNLAGLSSSMGNYAAAESFYRQSLEIKEKILGSDDLYLASGFNNFAALYDNEGKYAESEELYKKSLAIREKKQGKDHPDIANVLNNIGVLYFKQAKNNEAEQLFNKALKIYEKTYGNEHRQVISVITNLASIYIEQGRYIDAVSMAKKSIAIVEKMFGHDDPEVAFPLSSLARVCELQGNYEESEEIYKRILNIKEKTYGKSHPATAVTLNNLGLLYTKIERYDKADSLLTRSLNIYEKTFGSEHTGVALALDNLTNIYIRQNRFSEADSFSHRSIAIRQKIQGLTHPELGTPYMNLGGLNERQNKLEESARYYEKALNILENSRGPNHPEIVRPLINLARINKIRQKYAEAEPIFKRINNIQLEQIDRYFPGMSENGKEQFYSTLKNNFELFTDFAIRRMDKNPEIINELLNLQLSIKALILNSTNKVKRRILNGNDEELKNKYKQWIYLKEYINRTSSLTKDRLQRRNINPDSLEKAANEIEKELNARSEIFAKEFDKKRVTWRELQSKLKDNEAALEIIRYRLHDREFTDSVLYAVIILTKKMKDHPEIVLLNDGKNMEGSYLQAYLGMLQLEDKISYKRYFSRIETALPGNISKIYLSPDGVYNRINLLTLRKPDGKYLIEKYDIRLVGNLKDIVEPSFGANMKSNEKNTAELFGFPNYKLNESNFSVDTTAGRKERDTPFQRLNDLQRFALVDLPGTKMEVMEIQDLFLKKKWEINAHLGDDALEEKIKDLINPKVLHLATHGFFLEDAINDKSNSPNLSTRSFYDNPLLRSGLLFAGAQLTIEGKRSENPESDNGILTAYEAMNLNLDNTDLVVLSACQTGLGAIRNGEGVYGLQRAFYIAGAKSIIMSLWSVSDDATQELMTSFYSKWLSTGDKRTAFRDAQMKMKSKYKFPFFWGTFVMIGE
jgi:CHAT domain-containing protein/Tfp pilus assembly protein PilF